MIDSSLGQHQIQMAAIRQAISDGRLNAATLHQIMLDEISKELEKPLKEVDMDYVNLNTGALITFPDVLPSYWGYGHVMEAANPHEADCTGETEVSA